MRGILSFDGKGINGPDIYRSRIATFTNQEAAQLYGPAMAASMDMAKALDDLLEIFDEEIAGGIMREDTRIDAARAALAWRA